MRFRLSKLDRKIDRVAATVVRIESKMGKLDKLDQILEVQERMASQMNAFAGKWVQLERSYFTLHDRVGSHDRRFAALERSI